LAAVGRSESKEKWLRVALSAPPVKGRGAPGGKWQAMSCKKKRGGVRSGFFLQLIAWRFKLAACSANDDPDG